MPKKFIAALKSFFDSASDELFPKNYTCDLCGIETYGDNLCDDCKKTVNEISISCPVCGRKTKVAELCPECKARAPLFDKAVSAFTYRDGGARLILNFKNGNAYLKDFFADKLYEKCKNFTDAEAVCYTPMTKKAIMERGYNQAELLACALSKRLNLPVLDGVIKKIKETLPQKTLTRKEREDNLKGCFAVDKEKFKDKTVILVDDVMTTGATVETIVALIKKRGAKKVYVATAASVEYERNL